MSQREADQKGVVLVKKKPSTETYVSIMRAIKGGAFRPTMIVQSSKVPWITVMQCVRTLEQKGLIETGYDPVTGGVISKLTEVGNRLLEESN